MSRGATILADAAAARGPATTTEQGGPGDVASLADGHWQWSGWLTPKGRVIALFALLRFDAGKLWLLLPDADATQLRESLQRFVFRS